MPRIAYLVKQIERALRAQLDGALLPLGVTTSEYTALSILGARSGLSSAALSRRVFVTPQAMNQIVLELARRGLIRRKVSPDHRRVMHISLTSRGRAMLETCDRATLPVEERLLESLSRAEAAALRGVLSSCVRSLAGTAAPRNERGEDGHVERGKQNGARIQED